MDDLISRRAAIEEIQNAYCDTECGKDWCAVWKNKGLYEALRILEDVPPAQRWIPKEKETPYYKAFTPIWSCSKCGTEYDPSFCMTINFCPNCGADMREET